MKTIVLLLSLILSLLVCKGQSLVQEGKLWSSSTLSDQEYQYVSILNAGAIWSEKYNSPEPVYPDTKITPPSYERFTISGEDTIINSIAYKKLYMFYDSVFIKSKATVIGGIREDESKKVYYKGKKIHPLKPSTSIITNNGGHEGDEVLLYDFGIKIGDILKIDNLTMPDENLTVASIDTVLIGNTYRKEFSFKHGEYPYPGVKWIEGIGSMKGLLFTSGSTPTNGLYNDLICFKQNNEPLYFNNSYPSCFPDLSGNNKENTEFAPIGAEWYYSQYESYNPPQANYIKHTSIKDSIINGKPVKVIQKTRYQRSGATSLGYEYLHQNGDTIFYWKNNDFHVLYNFSLAKGDSLLTYSEMPGYLPNDPYGWVEIDSTYTTTINNHVLKTYRVTTKKMSYWDFGMHPIIEKIGSLTYLLPQNIGYVVDDPDIGPLRCYSDPELGEFHFEDLPCDTITTFPDGVNLYDRSLQVKVYPNPVSNDLFIAGNFKEKEYTLELYSIKGVLIKTECLEGGINIYKIDAGTLKSGSYILKVISEKGKYAEQMIIKN
ncbi:MAG TPA: T9SS type A sorting domain-containing protein [Prolixibacteraceae bacterium]|nr:T9SS type A sorting domain-containing protein [Prolixibacteraceae bacterium]